MRLIDADAVKRMLCGYCSNTLCDGDCEETDALDALPTIDPVKHGKWKEVWNDSRCCFVYECSICGRPRSGVSEWNYCPNCGAHMDKGESDA